MGEPIECSCCGGAAGDSDREYTDGDPVECGCDGIFSVDAEGFWLSVADCPCQDHDVLREAWVGTLARERAAMKRIATLESELREARAESAKYANAIDRIESVLGISGPHPLRKTVECVQDLATSYARLVAAKERG